MNKGKVIEETALKCATIAVSPGPGGSTMLTGNYEGSAPGLGKTVVTASFAGRHSGTFIAHDTHLAKTEKLSAAQRLINMRRPVPITGALTGYWNVPRVRHPSSKGKWI